MERVCALKSVRIWFNKDFECRYISHLDLNRCMLRALHKTKLPIWHTEGFNPHPFVTFPLPLSLGFRGVNECMDIKLEDEEYDCNDIVNKLNACLPKGIQTFKVTEPVMKAGKIAYAEFDIKVFDEKENAQTIYEKLDILLKMENIEMEKHSKKGMITVDVKKGIKDYKLKKLDDYVMLNIILSAGSSANTNPNLIFSALEKYEGVNYECDITRKDLYNSELELFR